MGRNLNAFKTLAYQGVRPGTPPNMVLNVRRPTLKDYIEYEIGDLWVIPKKGPSAPVADPTSEVWILVSKRYSQGIWKRLHGHGGGPSGPFVINQIVIGTPGAGTYTPSENMAEVQIEIIGGGGGGGGSGLPSGVSQGGGGGGGAGGYVSKIFSSTDIGASQPYFIGSGGIGGADGTFNGSNGTNSTFASGSILLTAGGGFGGTLAVTSGLLGGNGGSASGGSLNIAGQAGSSWGSQGATGSNTAPSGFGANTLYGAGGYPVWVTSPGAFPGGCDGLNGNGYGSGGSGGWTVADPAVASAAGGRGANGVLIITEYLS